jgi:hypothetical protein
MIQFPSRSRRIFNSTNRHRNSKSTGHRVFCLRFLATIIVIAITILLVKQQQSMFQKVVKDLSRLDVGPMQSHMQPQQQQHEVVRRVARDKATSVDDDDDATLRNAQPTTLMLVTETFSKKVQRLALLPNYEQSSAAEAAKGQNPRKRQGQPVRFRNARQQAFFQKLIANRKRKRFPPPYIHYGDANVNVSLFTASNKTHPDCLVVHHIPKTVRC